MEGVIFNISYGGLYQELMEQKELERQKKVAEKRAKDLKKRLEWVCSFWSTCAVVVT